MGEGGGAPLHAVCAAIQDALGPGAPVVTDSHNHWARVYEMLHRAPGTPRGVEVISRSGGSDTGVTSL
jgi:2-furoyl-CoA dehydrogenase large subunit